MKIRKILGVLALLGIALAMSACGSSIKEKKAEFEQTTLKALTDHGFVLEKKEENKEKSRYLLKLQQSENVSSMLVRNLTFGNNAVLLQKRLSPTLQGIHLELAVDWQKYAHAKPASVVATLLPKESNATGELNRLLKERKVVADLDYDKKGRVTRVSMHSIDETLSKDQKSAKLQLQGTELKVTYPTGKDAHQLFHLQSPLFHVEMKEKNATIVEMGYKGTSCEYDRQNAYYGTRRCKIEKLFLAMRKHKEESQITLQEIQSNSQSVLKKEGVSSNGKMTIASIEISQSSPHQKSRYEFKKSAIDADLGKISEEVYRQMMDLNRNFSTSKSIRKQKMFQILSNLFERMLVKYDVNIASMQGKLVNVTNKEEISFGGKGLSLGMELSLSNELNLSKVLKIGEFHLRHRKDAVTDRAGDLKGFEMKLDFEKIYNFIPKLLKFASTQTKSPKKHLNKAARKSLDELAQKVIHHGMVLHLDPLRFESLSFEDKGKKEAFQKMHLKLDMTLMENKLDFHNPMSKMLALAYLKAGGKLNLSKADFEKILLQLSPAIQIRMKQFVKYQGDQAEFELHYKQGALLINGKALK